MKKRTIILLTLALSFSLTACGSSNEKLETAKEPDAAAAALEILGDMSFTSIEEMETYLEAAPNDTTSDSNYTSRISSIEDESFFKKSPLEQFEIYVAEINDVKYRYDEKLELASKITALYKEATDKEVIEKMDSIIRLKLFKDGLLLEFFPEFADNEKLVLIAMENGGYLLFASERLQHDEEFLRNAMDRHGNGVLSCIDKDILTDKEFCLESFRKGYLEIYNRLIDEVSYSNNEKAKALLEDKEIITAIYESMQIMEFEELKELEDYINDPQLLADRLFGLFSEDFNDKRLDYVIEFRGR